MKTLKIGAIATISLIGLYLAACKKDSSAPSSTSPQLSFQMTADNATSGVATNSTFSGISGLNFTSGTANIALFKFEAKRSNLELELKSKNLTNIDLFSLSPATVNVTIDTGFYREIEISAMLQHSNNGVLPLKLNGTFTAPGGAVIPIEFDLNDDVTIKAEAENIHVTSTTDFIAAVHLHIRKLESGITAADLAAASQTNGTIIISSTSNSAIYNKVLANFAASGENEFRESHHGQDNGGHGNGSDDGSGHH